MAVVNKKELTSRMSKKTGMTLKDSSSAIDAFVSSITEALSNDEKVMLVGFGTFETRERKEKIARKPGTDELYTVPRQKAPFFKVGKELKKAVNKKEK